MALYIITVTEQPRIGQRKPRVHLFYAAGRTPAAAMATYRKSRYSELYGQGKSDTVTVDPKPDTQGVIRLR